MAARFHPTAGRRRRGVVLGVMALLAVLLSRPLAGPAPTVQAQDQHTKQVYTRCVAHGTPTFTVPAGVTQIHLDVVGAAGGSGDRGTHPSGSGGRGAWVVGDVAVTPGQQLRIYVGCTGQREGTPANGHGYTNGGSRGRGRGLSGGSGGTGGGSSAVTTAAGEVLIVAGGGGAGGGGGLTGAGGDGGNAGAAPQLGEGGDGPGRGDGGCAACVGGMMAGAGTDSSRLEDGGGGGGGGGGYCGPSCQGTNNGGGGHGGGHGAEVGAGGGGGGGAGSSYAAPAVSGTIIGTSGLLGDGQITLSWTPSAPGPPPTTAPTTLAQPRCTPWSGPLALIIPWQNCTG